MSNLKQIRKGENLFKAGEKADRLFLVQSGLISVFVTRPKKNIELCQATTGQLLGEEALLGNPVYGATAVALNDANVILLPMDLVRANLGKSPPIAQLALKGLLERQKSMGAELKSIRMERDTTPCPPDNIAKVFGVIHHVARHLGVKKADRVTVSWPAFKRYAQRIFLESPLRLEGACYILVNLGMADFEMIKDETDPDEDAPLVLGFFHFYDLPAVERFFEFFQNYHFKSESPGILKTDEKVTALVKALLTLSESERLDRRGIVYMNFKSTLEGLKKLLGAGFSPDQFTRIEQKGLFLKRESNASGGTISFYRQEYEIMIQSWTILREVEKWNERGIVDLLAPELRTRAKPVVAVEAPVEAPGETPAAVPLEPVRIDPDSEPVPVAEIAAKSAEKLCEVCLSKLDTAQAVCSVCGNEIKKAA